MERATGRLRMLTSSWTRAGTWPRKGSKLSTKKTKPRGYDKLMYTVYLLNPSRSHICFMNI